MSNTKILTLTLVLIIGVLLTACGSSSNKSTATSVSNTDATKAVTGTDSDGDGIPDDAEKLLMTDPNNPDTDGDGQNDLQDAQPLNAANPIQESSTTQGFVINSILVENNLAAGGGDAPDHLELSLTNTTNTDISGFDIYYSLTDTVDSSKAEAYYQQLPNLTLAAGETKSIHFDNTGAPDHFGFNPNSLYYVNEHQLNVEVMLHAAGYAPQTITTVKDAGGEGPE